MTESRCFVVISHLRVAENLREVEENTHYQAIRDEINAGLNGPDWRKIKQHAEKLGRQTGFGLLAAAYYTVAAARIDGVDGLADGLEIVLAAWLQPDWRDMQHRPATLNTLNWMANRVIEAIKQCEPSIDQLKILYRCERVCMTLNDALDKEVIGLRTLQEVLAQQIECIEKSIPPPPPASSETGASAGQRRFGVLVPALLFVCVVGLVVLMMFAEPRRSSPMDRLTERTAVPKVLSAQQADVVRQAYGVEEWRQYKDEISALYFYEIKQRLRREDTESLEQAGALLETLGRLYPDDDRVMEQEKLLQALKQVQQESLVDLSERFKQSRTAMANLSRAAKNLSSTDRKALRIKAMARKIENYAISLSPFLGRSLYIEQQLQQDELQRAGQELTKLGQYMNALDFKVNELRKALDRRLWEARQEGGETVSRNVELSRAPL